MGEQGPCLSRKFRGIPIARAGSRTLDSVAHDAKRRSDFHRQIRACGRRSSGNTCAHSHVHRADRWISIMSTVNIFDLLSEITDRLEHDLTTRHGQVDTGEVRRFVTYQEGYGTRNVFRRRQALQRSTRGFHLEDPVVVVLRQLRLH